MATVQRPEERFVDFDEYIDLQLDKTRNGIKWTDILAASAGVGALVVTYLVLFVVADHWLFDGGVPTTLRGILLGIVVAASVGWIGWKIVWPYLRRVSDLYAAQMLERAEPSLQGSLFGLVDGRRSGRAPIEEVRRALERRAATTLSSVDVDAALDRRRLMRTSYLLLAVVLLACVYAIASPKRIGPSLLRAMLPSANIGVATRTEILDVRPGDATVLAGEQLPVSVMIRGEAPAKVMLFYSTADRRFVDEPVELRLVDETTREYQAVLIGDAGRGLAQDLSYRIVANDDAAGPFAVDVDQPPTASITAIGLQFPAYTGLEPREQVTPAIDGVEGTNVIFKAAANRPLGSAKLVFADDELFLGRGEEFPLRLSEDGLTLSATWKLAIRSDGSAPTFYRIECRDKAGQSNPKPAVYPISIHPDVAPEVTLHDPKSDLERPANAVVPLIVAARDPDFRLRELALRIEKRGQELPDRTVLWEGSAPEAAVRYDWDLAPLGLKPGDVVSFYVQARDNREPEANRRNTPKLNITIREPAAREDVQKQLAEEKKRQDDEIAELEQNAAASNPETKSDDQNVGDADDRNPREDHQSDSTDEQGSDRNQPSPQDETTKSAADGKGGNRPQGEAGESEAVKNDGSQDDKVLRKLLEQQRQQPDQEPSQEKDGDEASSSASDAAQKQQSDNNRAGGSEGEKSDSSGKGRSEKPGSENKQPGEASSPDGHGNQSGKSGSAQNREPNRSRPDGEKGSDSGNQNASGKAPEKTADGPREEGPPATGSNPSDSSEQNRKPRESDSGKSGSAGSDGQDSAQMPDRTASRKESQPNQAQPQPTDGNSDPAPASEADPATSNANSRTSPPTDEPSGKSDPSPGDAQTDQKSQRPDSGEQGTGQPDVNGTPDKERGTADAGTKPGTQQPSDQATGQPGADATAKGRPGEGTSRNPTQGTPSSTNNDAQPGQPAAADPDSKNPPTDSLSDDPKSESPSQTPQKNAEQQPAGKSDTSPPTSDQPSPGQKPGGDAPPSQNDQGQPGPGEPGKGEPGKGEPGKGEPGKGESGKGESGKGESGKGESGKGESGKGESGKGESGKGESGKGESGKGESGKGESGKGESGKGESGKGEAGKGEAGKGEAGKGESGKGESGKGEAGKGEAGGEGNQPGQAAGQDGGKGGQPGGKPGSKGGQGGGSAPNAGGTNDGTEDDNAASSGAAAEPTADEANANYTKQATDLALKKLEDDLARGDVDPQLLSDLGWTEDDMRRFSERLRKNLGTPTGDESPQDLARRKEFEYMLENLTIESAPRAREGRNNRVRNVEGVGTKRPQVPSAYRQAYEAFTRSVANRRSTNTAPADTKKP